MSDELEGLIEDASAVVDGDTHQETGKGLRTQLEAANAELSQYKDRALDDAFARNGLTRDAGFGKAVAQLYDGDPTPEALEAHLVAEYGYENPGEDHPLAQTIGTEQSKLDQIGNQAGSISPPSDQDRLSAAEASGNYQETMRMKTDQMQGWFR